MIGKVQPLMIKRIKRGTKQGVDNKIVNRDLSYNVRIELANLETNVDIDNIFNIQKIKFLKK